jgi:hypothetical protein
MCFPGFAERHEPVDDRVNLARSGGRDRFVAIWKIRSRRSDDAQPPHVESLDVQFDFAAPVRAGGYEPPTDGEAIQCARPKRWIGNILANDIGSLIIRQTHDFVSQVLSAIIDAEVGAVTLCRCRSVIGPGTGNDFCSQHFGHLHAAASERARSAHDQNPFARLDVGFVCQKIERHREVARDDAAFGKGKFACQFERVPRWRRYIFRVPAPAMQPNVLATEAISLLSL